MLTAILILNDFYDKNCVDEMFDKYMKDTQPEYEKYMEKAQNLYNSNPPQPYAQEYIDNLRQCLK